MANFDDILNSVRKVSEKDPSTSIHNAGDINLISRAPYGILTGIPELDYSFGRPGLPAGKVVEYFGFEKSGKTTAALHALGQSQRKGGGGIFIDTEMSWDEQRAIDCGVDIDTNFAIAEADTIEGILRILESTIEGLKSSGWNNPFVAVVDSITGVSSQRHRDTEIGAEPRVGEDARVIRHGLRKLVSEFGKTNMTVIFINHSISNIASTPFAKQSTSAGGHAIKFFSSVRVQFTAGGDLFMQRQGVKKRIGQKTFLQIEKLKGSPLVYPKLECFLLNECGFDTRTSLKDAAIKSGLIQEKGKVLSLQLGEEPLEFDAKEWPNIVDSLGGTNVVYDNWIDWVIEQGLMKPWSNPVV